MKSAIHEHQTKNKLTVSKKQLSFLAISLSMLFFSCSSDSKPSQEKILQGRWKLVHVSGSFAGASSQFEPGVITWTFNTATNKVTIVNNNTDENLTDLFDTGVYNYQIVQSDNPEICPQVIKIDNIEMGCFSLSEGSLKIDQAFLDGYTVTLNP